MRLRRWEVIDTWNGRDSNQIGRAFTKAGADFSASWATALASKRPQAAIVVRRRQPRGDGIRLTWSICEMLAAVVAVIGGIGALLLVVGLATWT